MSYILMFTKNVQSPFATFRNLSTAHSELLPIKKIIDFNNLKITYQTQNIKKIIIKYSFVKFFQSRKQK